MWLVQRTFSLLPDHLSVPFCSCIVFHWIDGIIGSIIPLLLIIWDASSLLLLQIMLSEQPHKFLGVLGKGYLFTYCEMCLNCERDFQSYIQSFVWKNMLSLQ